MDITPKILNILGIALVVHILVGLFYARELFDYPVNNFRRVLYIVVLFAVPIIGPILVRTYARMSSPCFNEGQSDLGFSSGSKAFDTDD